VLINYVDRGQRANHYTMPPPTISNSQVKTASEMTYTVSGGALNSTQSNPSHPQQTQHVNNTPTNITTVSFL